MILCCVKVDLLVLSESHFIWPKFPWPCFSLGTQQRIMCFRSLFSVDKWEGCQSILREDPLFQKKKGSTKQRERLATAAQLKGPVQDRAFARQRSTF